MIRSIFISGLLILAGAVSAADPCHEELDKVIRYYQEHYAKAVIYIKLTTSTEENGASNHPLTTEIWRNGDYMKYRNPYLTVFQDGEHVVVIAPDEQNILIRRHAPAGNIKDPWANVSPAAQIDSLEQLAETMTCDIDNQTGILNLYFPDRVKGKPNTLKEIRLEYNLSSGAMKKGVYTYGNGEKTKKDIYQYDAFSHDFDKSEISRPAVSQVMTGQALKKTYEKYTITDLR